MRYPRKDVGPEISVPLEMTSVSHILSCFEHFVCHHVTFDSVHIKIDLLKRSVHAQIVIFHAYIIKRKNSLSVSPILDHQNDSNWHAANP